MHVNQFVLQRSYDEKDSGKETFEHENIDANLKFTQDLSGS